jgi:branched-chain amino acid transport system substrate-binding protein
MLAPSSSQLPSVEKTILIIQANNRRLPLLGGDSIYISPAILEDAGAQALGMVVAVYWDIDADQKSDFPERSARLWGGAEVNWITAMSYDATQAFISAMKLNADVTRANIQATLSSDDFSVMGASGTVRFLPNGDRNGKAQLVEVQPEPSSRFGYDFVPIP